MRQQGIILLTTGLVLSLVMLLLLAQIELINLHQKAQNQFIIRTQLLQHLENIAFQLIDKINHHNASSLPCIIDKIDPNKVINLVKNQQVGCFITDNNYTYNYVVEDLGLFNCIRIKDHNGGIYPTNQWRLTIALQEAQTSILQLRFANINSLKLKKCKQPVIIESGILSWRNLT
ncbi:hypothetical protein [Legionella gresilensis]|uniref:hypothetical protein n=1 Tax=Legionella gresilensis TaxID=91823 RepID=UPI0013EF9AFB|nr:hypothetical protein [Legionella gresilensis]